jgi:quercetin dioxygenase-like cupin family protein
MVKTNGVLDGPLTGEEFRYFGDKFRILQSSRSTQDVSLRVDYFAAPGANVPEHVHHHHEERIEVISGTLGLRIEGRRLTLGPGESAIGPPAIPHVWWNPSDDEKAHFLAEIRPGLDVEIMLETVHGLARDGKTIGETIPRNPLQLAVLAREFGSWGYFTGVPRPVRWTLFAPVRVLAFVGELLGYRASYPEYSGPEVAQTMRLPPETDRPLTLVSALWLLNSAIGARVAIREDLPAEWVAGLYAGSDASAEFFKGRGTALSPGLPMMAAQALFTVLSARGGTTGKIGAAGLVLLGSGGTIGVLAETITYRVLSPKTFDPDKAPIVSAAVVLSPLMVILGARRLSALRSAR